MEYLVIMGRVGYYKFLSGQPGPKQVQSKGQ